MHSIAAVRCSLKKFHFHYLLYFQDEITDLKSSKDVSHSTLEDLDTEDLYVKLKVCEINLCIYFCAFFCPITQLQA